MILLQGTNSDQPSDRQSIATYCKQFRLNDALQSLGRLSKRLVDQREPYAVINNVAISQSFIAYIAMVLIENASDTNTTLLSDEHVSALSSMWQNLPVKVTSPEDTQSIHVRLVLSEFYVQRSWRALLPRTLMIYDRLWSSVQGASRLNIEEAIKTEAGVTIKELIMFGAFYADKVQNGVIIESAPRTESTNRTAAFIAKQGHFFRWLETSYENFTSRVGIAHSDADERFRFNPLLIRPLIVPMQLTNGMPEGSRVAPSTPCLGLAVPEQIYHRLYERYQDKSNPRKNDFRTAFGHVFEQYVYVLLENARVSAELLPERVYDQRHSLKTSDITRIRNGKAVCIEVKLSGIRLNTYLSGDLNEVRNDIARNIVKAVSQLITLRTNMMEETKYESLAPWRQCEEFEHLVVLYDNPPRSNSLLRRLALEQLRIDCVPVPEGFHWHVIGIDDLENLLGIDNLDLFEFLKEKRRREYTDLMDFDEYIRHIRPDLEELSNPYLDSVGNELLKEFRAMLDEDRKRKP